MPPRELSRDKIQAATAITKGRALPLHPKSATDPTENPTTTHLFVFFIFVTKLYCTIPSNMDQRRSSDRNGGGAGPTQEVGAGVRGFRGVRGYPGYPNGFSSAVLP